eukprot:1378773-Amorphochlora_amoeboformis.AAC.1
MKLATEGIRHTPPSKMVKVGQILVSVTGEFAGEFVRPVCEVRAKISGESPSQSHASASDD